MPTKRAVTSLLPPVENGTMTRIARFESWSRRTQRASHTVCKFKHAALVDSGHERYHGGPRINVMLDFS